MISDDLIQEGQQETNLRSDNIVECTGPKQHFCSYQHRTLDCLMTILTIALSTITLFTRARPSVQFTESIKVLNQERSQSAPNNTNKKAKINEPEPYIDYQPNKQKCLRCIKVTFPAVRTEPTKAVTPLPAVYIKPTRPTISSLNAPQAYRVLQRPPRTLRLT